MRNEKLIKSYKELFGPVLYNYLQKLDSNIRYLDDGDTVFLFVTRAGVRIKKLYELYLEVNGLPKPSSMELFLSSRFLIAKSYLSTSPDFVESIFKNEYEGLTVRELLTGFVSQDPSTQISNWDVANLEGSAIEFIQNREYLRNAEVKSYLDNENEKFESYFEGLMNDSSRAVLIDSGWSGTIQSMLKKVKFEYEIYGLYFGRIEDEYTDSYVSANSLGLVFEAFKNDNFLGYDAGLPETAFTLHRHIIEHLFEPNASSVERIIKRDRRNYIAVDHKNILEEELKWNRDCIFMSVLEYIREVKRIKISKIHFNYRVAMNVLAEKLVFPSLDDVDLLGGLYRSADFGKSLLANDLLLVKDRFNGDSASIRIKESLWPTGQAVLEYNNYSKRRIRLEQGKLVAQNKKPACGSVAIITRTKDRPILLKRAAKSVADQTYTNYTWVVINDGGEAEAVDEVIRNSIVDPNKIIVMHNVENIGMEAASNKAISNCDSDYIVIHDDDDSWTPEFLEKTTSFLESIENYKYDAVVSATWYVSESIINDEVVFHGKWPYNDWLRSIDISEMFHGNMYAPIAFLFKRKIYQVVDGFDEALPVLGDWDFNLRYLMKSDIGVLNERLAFYHHRDRVETISEYSNSVIGGLSKHQEYHSIVRNKILRCADQKHTNSAVILTAVGYIGHDLRSRLNSNFDEFKNEMRNILTNEVRDIIAHQTRDVLGHELRETFSYFASEIDKKRCIEKNNMIEYYLDWSKENGITKKFSFYKKVINIFKREKKFPSEFDNSKYLELHPDVSKAVEKNQFKSGFHHYVLLGYKEGRRLV